MRNLIFILLLFISTLTFCQGLHPGITASSSQVIFYVSNAGNDNKTGLSQDSAWATISKVNGETFDPGDQIFFNKGDEWREQLTIPSSGSAGSPITFASYGTGDRPIINGSELATVWTNESGGVSGSSDWDAELDINFNNSTYQNFRQVIPASDLSETGTHVRILIKAHDTNAFTVSGASVGLRSGSTDDFSAPPTRLTFDTGSSTATVSANTDKYSDWIEYDSDPDTDQLIHIYYGTSTDDYVYKTTGGTSYRSTDGTDNTLTTTVDYGASAGAIRIVAGYEVGSEAVADSVWESTVSSDPKIVIFDDTLGIEALTLGAVDSLQKWFWGSNTLYTYSIADPSERFSEIEYGARDYGIVDGGDETYITIDGLEVKNSRKRAIMFLGDVDNANIIIDNCYAHHSREQGIYFNGYDNCTVQNSRSEYTGSGFYVSPNSDSILFTSDTAMYNIRYLNGTNTNGLSMDGHGFGIEESHDCIIEYCVAQSNWAGGFVVDQNNVANYDAILRYNKALGSDVVDFDNHGFNFGRIAATGTVQMYYNLSFDYGRNFSSNTFIDIDQSHAATIQIWNNTFVNTSDVDGNVIRWFDIANGLCDFRNNIVVSYTVSASVFNLIDATTNDFTSSDYNLYYSTDLGQPFEMGVTNYSSLANWTSGTSLDANSDEDNPDFTSEFTDFSLQVGSPAINTGVDVGLTEDILGNPIVGVPDMGAYEKQ